MTIYVLFLVIAAQVTLVAGQIFLKRGMTGMDQTPRPVRAVTLHLTAGIAMLTVWFLLWMGLLQQLELSFLYPFEGISIILLVLAACVMLRERLTVRSWIGVILITAGVVLVGMT